MPVFVVLIALTSYSLPHHGWGFDRITSYYAAMPGGLQDMLIYGAEAGANVRVLSLIHASRVLALVCLAPVVLHRFWGVDLHALPGQPAREIPLDEILLMIGARLAGWQIAARIGLFGSSILGPMILTMHKHKLWRHPNKLVQSTKCRSSAFARKCCKRRPDDRVRPNPMRHR